MTRSEWTICERSGRWAAAVRLASLRAKWPAAAMPRVFEVRQLVELEMRLDTQSSELVLVEVNRANFADMLPWLASRESTPSAGDLGRLDRWRCRSPRRPRAARRRLA